MTELLKQIWQSTRSLNILLTHWNPHTKELNVYHPNTPLNYKIHCLGIKIKYDSVFLKTVMLILEFLVITLLFYNHNYIK